MPSGLNSENVVNTAN